MPFLFVDQILNRDHPHRISGVKHITPDEPFLCLSPESDLCFFIPSLIGETIGQLAAWHVMAQKNFQVRPVAGVVAEAVMYRRAYVGQTLFLDCEIIALDDVAVEYCGHARINDQLVFSVQGAIGPLLPMEQFIDPQDARRQFQEINRPRCIEVLRQDVYDMPLHVENLPTCRMQFDKIEHLQAQQSCKAFKKISRSAEYFADHFPNKPVLPLTVLLECKRKLAEDFLVASGWSNQYRLQRMEKIKMSDFVQPGDMISTELKIKKMSPEALVLHFRSFLSDKRICVVDLVYQAEGSCNNVVLP